MKKFSIMMLIIALSAMMSAAAWAQSPLEVDEFSEFAPAGTQQPKAAQAEKSTTIKDGTTECAGGDDPFVDFGTRCGTVEKVQTIQLAPASVGLAPKKMEVGPTPTPPGTTDSTFTLSELNERKSVIGGVMIEAGGGNLSDYAHADYGFVRIGTALDFPVSVSHGVGVNASLGYQPERGAGMLFRNAWGSANETRLTLMGGYVFHQDDAVSVRLLAGPSYDFTNGDLALDFGAELSGHPGDFVTTARFFGHMEDDRYNTFLTQLEGLYDLKVARVGIGLDLLSLQDLASISNDWRWGMGLSAVTDFVIAERYIIGGSFGVLTMDGFASAGPFGAGRVGIQF